MTLTDDDKARLKAIGAEKDDRQVVVLIGDYWYDERRADRTPRSYFYFHIGMLSGMVMRLLAERQ